MVVGSFNKIFDSQRIEFIPQVQSVRRSGVYRLECTRDLGEVGQVPFPGRT